MGVEAGSQRLQLLADVLSAEFSQSQASAACATALTRLLPSLQYLSVAVSNPSQGGTIVASGNCATEGPTTLHLHDPLSSAAGRVVSLGKMLQTSLLNGAAASVLPLWTDVQLMMTHAPGVTHILCIPFGCDGTAGEDDSSTASGNGACRQHSLQQGSGRGALLFGFSAAPELDARRKALLAGLAQCLPAPMARLSTDTLAFVNFVCGSNTQCSCCCCTDEGEEEEEEDAGPEGPCREDDGSSSSGGGAAPSQALRVPGLGGTAVEDAAGRSSRSNAVASSSGRKAAAAAVSAGVAAEPAGPQAGPGSEPSSPGSPQPSFSKALLSLAAESGAAATAQHPLTLCFRHSPLEQAYGQWTAQQHLKGDLLFSLLLLPTLAVVAGVRVSPLPYRLVEQAPNCLVLGLGVALPLLLGWLARSRISLGWRQVLVAAFRLYAVAAMNLVCVRAYQAQLTQGQQWVAFWRLTGVESLCITAIGFRTTLRLHLLLQSAALAMVVWNLPRVCASSFFAVPPSACFRGCAALAVALGHLVPTAALRLIEQRSRATFARQLHAAAAHEH